MKIYLLGAGKHAKEVSEYLQETGEYSLDGYIVNVQYDLDYSAVVKPVIAFENFLKDYEASDGMRLMGAIGDYRRKLMIEPLEQSGYRFINLIHRHAYVSPSLIIGIGNCIAPGCVVNANVRIGNHCIVNSKSNLSHDTLLEDFVTISPGVTIAGNVHIGEGVFIGSGAIVIPGISIGRGAYVAAGACITANVPPNVMIAGVPGRVKKIVNNYPLTNA